MFSRFSFNGFLVDGILTNSTPRDGIYTYPLQMSIGHYNQTSSQIENSRLYNLELDLYTNFGKISKTFSITGAYSGYISLDLNTSDIIYPSRGSIIGNEDETNILVNTKILSGFRSDLFELDKIIQTIKY